MTKKTFSTFYICKALNINYATLREWCLKYFVGPSIKANGQGTRALFTLQDVYNIQAFKELLQAGMSRKKAAQFIKDHPVWNEGANINVVSLNPTKIITDVNKTLQIGETKQ